MSLAMTDVSSRTLLGCCGQDTPDGTCHNSPRRVKRTNCSLDPRQAQLSYCLQLGAMHFFAQLISYELESSLQVMKCLALLMLKQADGAKKCIAPGGKRRPHRAGLHSVSTTL